MVRRILRRVLASILLLAGISFFSFLLMHTAQGDFLSAMQMNPQIDPATIASARTQFGLDQPWYLQYLKWIREITRGNFGYSFSYRQPVSQIIQSYVLNTLLLMGSALGVSLLVAFPLGILSALKKDSWIDRAVHLVSTLGISLPTLLAALLALWFAAKTRWFPIGGMGMFSEAESYGPDRWMDLLHHLALPVVVLAIHPTILYLRQVRSNLSEVLKDPFILAVRAKGLPSKRVIWHHATRNAMNPLFSLFGFSVANLLNGAFLVEYIMNWPGLGRLTYDALLSRDLYLVMGSLTMASLMLVAGNLLADLLIAWNDPRIKASSI